jgi:hypothetical protein
LKISLLLPILATFYEFSHVLKKVGRGSAMTYFQFDIF